MGMDARPTTAAHPKAVTISPKRNSKNYSQDVSFLKFMFKDFEQFLKFFQNCGAFGVKQRNPSLSWFYPVKNQAIMANIFA
jgi:hypothetical protein